MLTNIHIGPAGWSYPDWTGAVYPSKKQRGFDSLAFLASYFNLIEINSTFYRIPPRKTCTSWFERIEWRPDFVFTVKAFNEFTHKRTAPLSGDIDVFKKAIDPIYTGGRLGAVLIQFPWSFRYSEETRNYVADVTDAFRPFPTSVEVRHGSWATDDARSFFTEQRLTQCGIDQPQIGDSLAADTHVDGPSGAYFRLHGRNYGEWFRADGNRDTRYNYLYNTEELGEWKKRLLRSAGRKMPVYAVMNNHFRGQAVANALQLRAMISGKPEKAPPQLLRLYPHLAPDLIPDPAHDDPPIQGSLFEDGN